MAFLKDLLSPGPGVGDEFSKEWQDAFGMFDPPAGTGATSGGQAARLPSNPPSPTGFLPSQLLDHSLSSTGQTLPSAGGTSFLHHTDDFYCVIQKRQKTTSRFSLSGWSTPPMFQAPPLQPPSQNQSAQPAPSSTANGKLLSEQVFVLED